MTILGHLISSHKLKKRHVETVGLIVRTLTVRETAAVARGGKGEMLSAQGKKRFTISPWLPRQTYITVNIWKQKKVQENLNEGTIEEREKKETRWCHGFHSKRTRSSQQGKRTNTKLFFPFCLILSVSCGDSERQLQSSPRVSADVATWPYLASQERGGGGRKEGGEGQNSTSGFYQRLIWSQQQALKHSVNAE